MLNLCQQEAASVLVGPLRIIAGPGTGKTRVLVERTINLIQQHGVEPQRILLLTFTNKAAHEIKNRLERRGFGAAQAMTFHSLAARFLREFWKKDFEIDRSCHPDHLLSSRAHSTPRLRRVAQGRLQSRDLATHFSSNESEMTDKVGVTNKVTLTFDELLTTLLNLWREQTEILKICQSRFDCIMVDEYQDVNADQIEIARLLAAPHRNIAVVGDPDQCIYSWRGSRPDSLDHFLTLFPGAKTIILEENYRNPPKILGAAMQLMAREPRPRLMHPLRTISMVEAPVNLWTFTNSEERDAAIVSLLERHLGSHVDMLQADELDRSSDVHGHQLHRHFEDIAILFRTQEEGKGIARLLGQKGYPYQMSRPENFWETDEVREFMDALNKELLKNIFLRALGYALRRPRTRSAAGLSELIAYPSRKDIFQKFLKFKITKSSSFSSFLHAHLSSFLSTHPLTDDQQTTLLQLLPLSMDFDTLPPDEALRSFLDLPKLAEDQDNLIKVPGINLLTLHAAKGLEFPIVIIVGLSDGNIPQKSAMKDPAELAEERRLLYVGMTRAREELHLMSTTNQKIGSKIPSAPSRFLGDMMGGEWFQTQELHPARLSAIKRCLAKRAQMRMF